jgi:anti-anti-sigma factor
MFASCLKRWFFSPAEYADCDNRPAKEALTVRDAQVASGPAATPTVEVTINQTADDFVIQLKGEANFDAAAALAGSLLAPAARRAGTVRLDLSGLKSISALAMGILVRYRSDVIRNGGRVRLTGALQPAVQEVLVRVKLIELFETTSFEVASGRYPVAV